MTRRKIFLHGMRWVDVQTKIDSKNDAHKSDPDKSDNSEQAPKKENALTKDRKIKLDKMIKGNGFREI